MCVSCACGKPNESHGDERNITMDKLQQAATAANIPVDQVARNLQQAVGGTQRRAS